MAVSFKVPASPKRNIFVIDEFMGVDLTNTGANIDEHRSPNAENMIRYVPGKVRKRMGYENNIQFGTPTNVNRAIGTSEKEQRFTLNAYVPAAAYTKLYDLAVEIPASTIIYFEFDYKAEHRFWLGQYNAWIPASEEYTHFSGSYQLPSISTHVSAIGDSDAPDGQEIYIRNFSLMTAKDADYTYRKAPRYYVERLTNDPIFGVHVLKTGTFEGNRVRNVNRALNTSSTFATYNVSDDWVAIGQMGEIPYPGRKVWVEFDYRLSGDSVSVALGTVTSETLSDTSGAVAHFGAWIEAATYTSSIIYVGTASTATATVEIRNLAALYDKGETYDWSIAPEDAGGTFPIEDTYYVGSENYAITEEFSDQSLCSSGVPTTVVINVADADSHVEGFCHLSFDLHTSSSYALTSFDLQICNDQNQLLWSKTFTDHLNSEHFDFYISAADANYYVEQLRLVYLCAGGVAWTYVKNIKINTITPKTSYDVSTKQYLYHVGKDFYIRPSNSDSFTKVYSDANSHLSKSWQFNKSLYILDGKSIYSYTDGGSTVDPIDETNGYVPTVTIAKEPHGGGTPYEPLNYLQPAFIETFQGVANWQMFFLSFGNLDQTPVRAWVLNSSGVWVEQIEGTDFTVNRQLGMIDFINSPGASPITGEDNVKIQAYRTVPGYRDRITKCTNGTLFGVGGAEDRLFLTGNPDYPNWDFYSEQYNPTYFPDTGYSALGSEASAIVGYALVNNYLAAFKDGGDLTQSVFIREGDLIVDSNTGMTEPAFKLINTLQGNGVIAPYAFGNLQTEPVFLTRSGIFAITAQDITGEKYSQNRSFYLNGRLTQEPNLDEAVATVYNDMYILAVNNQLYVLDGLQATRTDRSEPYATRQYVGYHCTNVPAVCIWNDDALWFGTMDGKVCKFHTDEEDLDSYSDDGDPIYCCWETPDLDGKLFYKNKTFRYFAIRMMKALRTSVKLWSQKLGNWTFIKEDTASGVAFDFENIDFELFSFSTDRSEKVVHTKVRVKKVDKARFRVENGKLNEPFGLFDLALEYIESGNYKG